MGFSLDDALAKVTSVPAEVVHMAGEIGTLAPGAWGDAVILELREGEFQLQDTSGQTRIGRQNLASVTVVKSGAVYRQHPATED